MTKLKEALIDAYDSEMAGLEAEASDAPEHVFSAEFEHKMKAAFKIAERRYVHVGRIRMRRAVMLAVIVALLVATTLATIAVAKPDLFYVIKKNNVSWNMFFEQRGTVTGEEGFTRIKPVAPEEYKVTKEVKSSLAYDIYYKNGTEQTIAYSQILAEGAGTGLDAENTGIHETTINGHKAIVSHKDGYHMIFFDDGLCIYQLYGNCDYSTLKSLAVSVINQFDKKTK